MAASVVPEVAAQVGAPPTEEKDGAIVAEIESDIAKRVDLFEILSGLVQSCPVSRLIDLANSAFPKCTGNALHCASIARTQIDTDAPGLIDNFNELNQRSERLARNLVEINDILARLKGAHQDFQDNLRKKLQAVEAEAKMQQKILNELVPHLGTMHKSIQNTSSPP